MSDENKTANTKPAGKKKEKPPKVEEKPFDEFITQHFIPQLREALGTEGIDDLYLSLEQEKLPLANTTEVPECWQVIGIWNNGKRRFSLGFAKDDISAPKFFCAADAGGQPSTLESFMIDERRVTLDLLVLYVVQRLNGQKWLTRN
jgi:hypothetical protein